jgi:hypothetical protein
MGIGGLLYRSGLERRGVLALLENLKKGMKQRQGRKKDKEAEWKKLKSVRDKSEGRKTGNCGRNK